MKQRANNEGLRVLDDFLCEAIHAPRIPLADAQNQGNNEGIEVVERIKSDDQNEFEVPAPDMYKHAILALGRIPPKHLAMLKAHFQSARHTITAGQLARAVGYQNYRAINLQYGKLADRLCQAIGKNPATRLAILVTFEKDGIEQQEHWKLVMRPELVRALIELGWFEQKNRRR